MFQATGGGLLTLAAWSASRTAGLALAGLLALAAGIASERGR
ncbi:hypothetical protein ACFY2K_26265 [Kitasatospora sp. NPDC001309]